MSSVCRKSRARSHRHHNDDPVDVFRLPLKGEDPFLRKSDGVYTALDDRSLLIVRDLKPGTEVDGRSVARLQNYYERLRESRKCSTCRNAYVGCQPSIAESTERTGESSFRSSRITSSVVTPPSSGPSECQSMPQEPTTFSATSSTNSALAVDFTAMIKDPKSGKAYPLHFVAKSAHGQPTRVFINGKAFGPATD